MKQIILGLALLTGFSVSAQAELRNDRIALQSTYDNAEVVVLLGTTYSGEEQFIVIDDAIKDEPSFSLLVVTFRDKNGNKITEFTSTAHIIADGLARWQVDAGFKNACKRGSYLEMGFTSGSDKIHYYNVSLAGFTAAYNEAR